MSGSDVDTPHGTRLPPARILFWAATVGGIALTARSILLEPPPLFVAIGCAALYVGLVLAGVFVLRLGVFVDALVRGPSGARGVVLTFDDGPHPTYTRAILDVLDAHDAKATFFVIGHKADEHPDVVREIVARGHAVGLHGYAHDRFFSLRGEKRVRADLVRAMRALERITNDAPVIFRPPIGHTNPIIGRVAEALGLVIVGWSTSARDGDARSDPEAVVRRVKRGLVDGAIVLLHDAAERDERRPAALAALPALLDAVAAKNLTVVPLASWLGELPTAAHASSGGAAPNA